MAHDSKIDMLRLLPGLRDARERDLAALAVDVDVVDVDAGTVLMEKGALAREAFIIVSGEVEVTREGRTLATLGPGEFLGEMGVLSHAPRSATATTMVPTRLLVSDPRSFSALLHDHHVVHSLLEALSMRLRAIDADPVTHGRDRSETPTLSG